jgi:glutathione S-transferase
MHPSSVNPPSFQSRLPVLYSFRRCPYAIRARLALKVGALQVFAREVDLRQKPLELVALSPKATVPVLALPDGAVLDESLAIMQWALALNDPESWVLREEAAEVRALVTLNDGPFKRLLDQYKYAERLPEYPAAFYRDEAVRLMLAPLEARLSARPYLLRETPSVADMAILPFVRQFAAVDPDWFHDSPLMFVRNWMLGLTRSELFHSVMQKRAVWRPGDPEVAL